MEYIKKSWVPIILICLLIISQGEAQPQPQEAGPLSSPYHTVRTHLSNLQPDQYDPEKASTAFDQTNITKKEAIDLARKLKQAWDGTGTFISVETLPREPNYRDTISGRQRFVVTEKYPDIYLSKIGNQWVYDPGSYHAIRQLYGQVYPLGSDWLMNLTPHLGHKQFLGLYIWQYTGFLIFISAGFLIYWIASVFFRKVLRKLFSRISQNDLAKSYLRPVVKPFSWILVILFLLALIPMLQLPINTNRYIILALKTLLPVLSILVFYNLVDVLSLYLDRLAQRTKSTMDDQLVPIVRRSLKIFVIVIGGLFILHNLNVNITTLLAGLSIGGLALALAAQDTLKNFLGSVMIFIDRPFQIGDWISSDSIDGTVEEVGFRSTRIRTFSNSLVTVPNGRLSDLDY